MGSWMKGTWLVLLENGSSSTVIEAGTSRREAPSPVGTAGCVRQHLYSSDCICLGGNGRSMTKPVQLNNFQANLWDVTDQPRGAVRYIHTYGGSGSQLLDREYHTEQLLCSCCLTQKKERQTSNTTATPGIGVLEKSIARARGAQGCFCVLSPRRRFDPTPEQRTGGRSGRACLGNVLKSTSRNVESLTLFQDVLFVLDGKTSAFYPTFPVISLSIFCISFHSTDMSVSG